MNVETKYQTVTVVVPSGSTAGAPLTYEFNLESNWDSCTGVCAYTTSAAPGSTAMRVALRSGAGLTYQNSTFIGDLESSHLNEQNNRYKVFLFPAKGERYVLEFTPITVPGAAITYDVVFRLIRK